MGTAKYREGQRYSNIKHLPRRCFEETAVKYAVVHKLKRSRMTPQQTCISAVSVTGLTTGCASWT